MTGLENAKCLPPASAAWLTLGVGVIVGDYDLDERKQHLQNESKKRVNQRQTGGRDEKRMKAKACKTEGNRGEGNIY